MSLLMLLLACSGGPQGGPGKEGGRPPVTDPRTLVSVETLETGSVSQVLISNGVVESEAQADLVPEATGSVVAIKAEEGDRVRKGQVLAIIDNASLDAGLARAEAELARAQAELERARALHEKGAVSERELQEAVYAEKSAATALKEAQGTQGHTRIVSPIDGTVAVRELQYGEVAGGTRAFQVVDLTRLRVVIKLPERDLSKLAVGQKATLVGLYDDAQQVPGHVERISPTVDASSGTVRVTVALDDPDGVLRPGQFVSVSLQVDRHDDVLVLPRRAVFYEEGDPLAFRVSTEPDFCVEAEQDEETSPADEGAEKGWGRKGEEVEEDPGAPEIEIPGPCRVARKVALELGFEGEDTVEVISGLAVGDQVVVVGQSGMRDETRVRLPEDPKLEIPEDEPEEDEPQEGAEQEAAEADAETEG
ncbi:MAG: efflux RND transporter periplasmic adaptor subunit [Myxococcota bacterium]|nr:efflux RND transporter periplasmic adaptor subunit [Myxococcota bacterium]